MRRPTALVLALLLGLVSAASAQEGFGKNKVVLKDFDWKFRSTEHFDIYYYPESEPWVEKTAEYLEKSYRDVAGDLQVDFDKKRPFFLYATVNDMQQSNIVTVGDGVGGVTEPLKDRFMAYADGSEDWLENVIRHEYGHVVEFRVLVDGFWRSARVLKTVVYPLWFMEGLAEAYTYNMDKTEEDQVLRDLAVDDKLISLVRLQHVGHLKPHQVTPAYKEAGAAMHFIKDQYGSAKLAELLRGFQSRFDASAALQDTIGLDLFTFDKKFREYLRDKYSDQVRAQKLSEPVGRAVTPVDDEIPQFNTSPRYTPDGKAVVYLSTREGFPAIVETRDLETGRWRKLVGHKHEWVENIPMGRFSEVSRTLDVSPDGRTVAFCGQKNHKELIYLADLRTGELSRLSLGMQTVLSPAFSPDGKTLAFAGMRGGHTDIFVYELATQKLEYLTSSDADDQTPHFSPDGRSLVYSIEVSEPGMDPPHQRDLYVMDLETRKSRRITELQGSERDPTFSPDGKSVLFTADPDYINDLYELDLDSGRIARRTRSIGGSLTGAYSPDGKSIMFSAYRKNTVTLREIAREKLLDEEVKPGTVAKAAVETSTSPVKFELSRAERYRFRMDTDLFLPAFFFSSQGGLFWTSYWQASDFLGDHQLTNFINLNTGQGFLNYSLNYTYGRFRPQWNLGLQGFHARDILDERLDREYTVKLHRQFVGVGYPFDRFHRMEFVAANQLEDREYESTTLETNKDARTLGASFVRDTVEGRYLVATRGSRHRLGVTRSFEVLGGNQDYNTYSAEAHQFIPTGGQSAFALRGVASLSHGPDAEDLRLPLGGPGAVRGFTRHLGARAGTRIALANVEWRFPIVQNLDYYMWFIFPDLYFKAVFGTVFFDVGHAWDRESQLRSADWNSLSKAAGAGIRVHTFVLQRFPFVLAIDYARQLGFQKDYRIYLYLGPLF